MDHTCIVIILCLLGISTCAHQNLPINHQPIADRIMHHMIKNQNLMQQLKYFEEFQFDFSMMSDQNCFHLPKSSCLKELTKIALGPNVGKCESKISLCYSHHKRYQQ